jgi:hypothetical protein
MIGQSDVAERTLRNWDEALLRAMMTNDGAVWKKLTTNDFVFAAEDSTLHDRNDFLQALRSTPKIGDVSAPAPEIRGYLMRRIGDTAIVTYLEYETGSYLGSPLTGHDLVTETWQRVNGKWKLRLLHMTAVPTDPDFVQLPPDEIDSLAGTYRAEDAIYVIRRDGDRILASYNGGLERERKAAAYDTLFTPGLPRMRMIFRRDERGKIVGFSSRNENRAIFFKRVELQ